ncbi:MAG TPA: hypothetical protein PKH60_04345 [Candidatus Woesebacteria bacterium]|nr:hypothetical protein [Candidatus Woesebacteria bacterium]
MTWETSKTGRFGSSELKMLEEMPIEELIQAVLSSQPLVALRVFGELVLQRAQDRYLALVEDPNFKDTITGFEADADVSKADFIYEQVYLILAN